MGLTNNTWRNDLLFPCEYFTGQDDHPEYLGQTRGGGGGLGGGGGKEKKEKKEKKDCLRPQSLAPPLPWGLPHRAQAPGAPVSLGPWAPGPLGLGSWAWAPGHVPTSSAVPCRPQTEFLRLCPLPDFRILYVVTLPVAHHTARARPGACALFAMRVLGPTQAWSSSLESGVWEFGSRV